VTCNSDKVEKKKNQETRRWRGEGQLGEPLSVEGCKNTWAGRLHVAVAFQGTHVGRLNYLCETQELFCYEIRAEFCGKSCS